MDITEKAVISNLGYEIIEKLKNRKISVNDAGSKGFEILKGP